MFSKKPAAEPRNNGSKPMTGSATFSVIGPDVVIKGNIIATADLHVDGRVEGDITCAALVQGEQSTILGAVEAQSARFAGHVDGSVHARELVILRGAKIEGDVHYDALTIEQGAEVEGRFSHRAPREPAASEPASDKSTIPAAEQAAGDDAEPRLTLAG